MHMMVRRAGYVLLVGAAVAGAQSAPSSPLVKLLEDELKYSMDNLKTEDGLKPYYLAYTVYEESTSVHAASLGALANDTRNHARTLNIDMRVGDFKLDNTHQIRGRGGSFSQYSPTSASLPLSDNPDAIRQILWHNTDEAFKDAVQAYQQVQTNLKVKVEEEDQSDDFSKESPNVFSEPALPSTFDPAGWKDRLRRISALAREYPLVYQSGVTLGTSSATTTIVSSEGARIVTSLQRFRVTLQAATKADDGMTLTQSDDFNAAVPDKLPDEKTVAEAFRKVLDQVMALRAAPLAQPYTGPAILLNRASGVFFHEIFGHRIEGHRQRDVSEGQTFTKKVGKPVLPDFISVVDDPTRKLFGDIDLRGYYRFDDEGVAAAKVTLVDKGVLSTFLMSRTPVAGVPQSNGHGRRQPGSGAVSRQANLIVESSKSVPFPKLREMLIEECKTAGKPYGLLFEDISGGFTMTQRQGPQSFKVLPIVVYRVYADGRADELIRGVDIVGTPLSCFERILCTGDDPDVFNGSCGAESGWVPVSAVSPSVLVSTIEIEKREVDQSRPPILPSPMLDPVFDKAASGGHGTSDQ
ncbi:MAG: hypothetical protein IT449_01010 [Phycisphaerales bacterium]|nr:hypothetical protein [Phycisphaerales bacterium]